MTVLSLSEAAIRQQATAESFRREEDYYRRGAVVSGVQRGNTIQSEVEGGQQEPYRVRVTCDNWRVSDEPQETPDAGMAVGTGPD